MTLSKAVKLLDTTSTKTNTHEIQIKNKIEKKEINDFRELIKILPDKDDVERLKKFMNDSIASFRADNRQFHMDFKIQNEIIRQYDEVLSQRASKVSLREAKDELGKYTDKRTLETMTSLQEVKNHMQYQMDKLFNV